MISMRACSRAISAGTFPGNPTIVPKNMEGAGSLRLANWLYNVGAKDGTVLGTIGRGTGFDPLLGSKGAQFQADKFTWVGSANNEVSICVAWKGSGITKFEDTMTKELIVGGTGAGRRHRPVPAHPQRRARHQVQDRVRLSGRQRHHLGDGARRGEGALRLVVVERGRHPQALGRRQDHHRPGAAVARQASRPARCPAGHGFRQDRRAEADLQADLRPPGDGPAVPGAARPAQGPRRGAAQGVRRHHEGSRVPRRCDAHAARDHAGGRRGGREAGDRALPDPQAGRRHRRRSSSAARRGERTRCRKRRARTIAAGSRTSSST